MMVKVSTEVHEALRNNKQVFPPAGKPRWMTLDELRKAVIAGGADDWDVLDIDPETDEIIVKCPYCVTGVEHPTDWSWPMTPEASVTLH
jgi:hypothetical protein